MSMEGFRKSMNGRSHTITAIVAFVTMITGAVVYAENNYLKKDDLKPIAQQITSLNNKMDNLIIMNKIASLTAEIATIEQKVSVLKADEENLSLKEREELSQLTQKRERKLLDLKSLQNEAS